tara:strand:- start:93 stop:245 length:153 start_codon:yes stop_codon:yes gene_type:complete
MDKKNNAQIFSSQDVIVLEDLFFIRSNAIKNNTEVAKEALSKIFENISFN